MLFSGQVSFKIPKVGSKKKNKVSVSIFKYLDEKFKKVVTLCLMLFGITTFNRITPIFQLMNFNHDHLYKHMIQTQCSF